VAQITPTTADVFIKEVWASDAFEAAQFARVIADRVNRSAEKDMQKGDTYHKGVRSNMTATTKTPGTAVTKEAITETKTDLSVQTWKYVAFGVDRISQVQAQPDQLKLYTDGIGYPLQRAVEISLSGIFDTLATVVGVAGQDPTWDDWRSAWQKLREAGVGEGNLSNMVSWIISPAMQASAMGLDVFISKDYVASAKAVEEAEIGRVLGWPVFTSNLLESDATGQHDNAVFHRDQYLLVEQGGINVESDYIVEDIGTTVVADIIYGFVEVGHAPETAGGGSAVDTRGVYFKGT
jgi:hypothetical protein